MLGDAETLAITKSAVRDAFAIGFEPEDVAMTISTIERPMFLKSMTTYADKRVWQDVYHVPSGEFVIYVKFQSDLVTEFRVMSFKEV